MCQETVNFLCGQFAEISASWTASLPSLQISSIGELHWAKAEKE